MTPEKRKAYDKAYRAANKERRAANDKAYSASNKARRAAASRAWHATHKGHANARTKAWKANNPEKVRAYDALRRALKSRACPAWADLKAIEEIYASCPEDHHIDHISPLKGPSLARQVGTGRQPIVAPEAP
jgi:hypothetical protein